MSAIYQSAPWRVIKYGTVRVDSASAASTFSAVDVEGRRADTALAPRDFPAAADRRTVHGDGADCTG